MQRQKKCDYFAFEFNVLVVIGVFRYESAGIRFELQLIFFKERIPTTEKLKTLIQLNLEIRVMEWQ